MAVVKQAVEDGMAATGSPNTVPLSPTGRMDVTSLALRSYRLLTNWKNWQAASGANGIRLRAFVHCVRIRPTSPLWTKGRVSSSCH